MAETDRLAMMKEHWNHADEGLRNERDRMREAFSFRCGIQWNPEDIETLDKVSRPHITINRIHPIVNLLSGYQRQNRQDIKVFARRGGIVPVADILTELHRHAMDMGDGDYELADVFSDGITGGLGWIGVDVDYTYDPLQGDLKIGRLSPFEMRYDPDCKEYDINKGNYVIRDWWWNKEECALSFPNKQADLEGGGLDIDPGSDDIQTGYGDEYEDSKDSSANPAKYRYRVRSEYWKSFEQKIMLINMRTMEVRAVAKSKRKDAMAIAAAFPEYRVVERVVPVLHHTMSVGNIILEDKESPFGNLILFPYARFCPYWVDGYVMGVVDQLIDPQREYNKRRSQFLHIINTQPNSGFTYKTGDLTPEQEKKWAAFGSKPGFMGEYARNKPERIDPPPVPQAHAIATTESANELEAISSVGAAMRGFSENSNESGKLYNAKVQSGMAGSEIMFDNFNRTQKAFANLIIEIIRNTDLYSQDEIAMIVQERNQNIDLNAIKSMSTGRYGIKVDQSPNAPSIRYANFMEMIEIAKMYPQQIPPEAIIEQSDMPNKESILQRMQAAQQQAPQQLVGVV